MDLKIGFQNINGLATFKTICGCCGSFFADTIEEMNSKNMGLTFMLNPPADKLHKEGVHLGFTNVNMWGEKSRPVDIAISYDTVKLGVDVLVVKKLKKPT